jgi:hypothetical protein
MARWVKRLYMKRFWYYTFLPPLLLIQPEWPLSYTLFLSVYNTFTVHACLFRLTEDGGGDGAKSDEWARSVVFFPIMLRLQDIHCKKNLPIFPSSAGMSLTKLSLAENNLIIPGQRDFGK